MDNSISCIIINTFNDFFVKNRTIPSILETTRNLDWVEYRNYCYR